MSRFAAFALILFLSRGANGAFVCEPGGSEGPLQTVRNFYWIAMGFPGDDEYDCATGNSPAVEEMFGKEGLAGRIEGIRDFVAKKIVAREGSDLTCEKIKSSGSFDVSDVETLTYQEPTQLPPESFPYKELYTKRVRYENQDTGRVAIFEFHCDRASMMAKVVDTLDNGTQTMVIFYDGQDPDAKAIDFYLHDSGNFGTNLKLAVLARTSDDNFRLYMTRSGVDGSTAVKPYRFAVKSALATGIATIFFQDLSGEGLNTGNFAAAPGISDVDVTSATAPNAGATDAKRHGCAPNFSVATSALTSSSACPGLAIDATPETAFGFPMSMLSVELSLPEALADI